MNINSCDLISIVITCALLQYQLMNRLFYILFILFSFGLQAQGDLTNNRYEFPEKIPADYFSSPLKIPIELSGTFGELRNNHFHAGLDIRTQQREGIPIYAAADGYVNRLRVAHFSYGKAVYIQHPNGYSTLYGHLQRFAGDIEDLVRTTQYEKESYEIEIYPTAERLPVKKGDLIGYTGNTGSSGGPHLHFEIRDRASRPMNPKFFGFEVADTRKPLIKSVFVYPIGDDSHVNQLSTPRQLRLTPQTDGNYISEKIKASGTLGFGLSAVDQQNAANNRNGVFRVTTLYNGEPSIDIVFDRISFDETRYINRFIDYGYFKNHKSRVKKLFIERNNPLSIFKTSRKNGFIAIQEGFNSVYTIEVSDYSGNTVLITIPIEGVHHPVETKTETDSLNHFVSAGEGATIKEGKFTIYFPPRSLYEDAYLNIRAEGDRLYFHKDNIPIHSNVTISADVSNYKSEDIDKVYIGKLNFRGNATYNNTKLEGNVLSTQVREFGTYGLTIDTVPPVITPVNFSDGRWISSNQTLQIRIQDAQSGVKSYRAMVNDKWILMEYEYKNNMLTHHFSDNVVTDTENILKLIVTDNAGNSSKFEATFFRK
jgi:hypothetical protein